VRGDPPFVDRSLGAEGQRREQGGRAPVAHRQLGGLARETTRAIQLLEHTVEEQREVAAVDDARGSLVAHGELDSAVRAVAIELHRVHGEARVVRADLVAVVDVHAARLVVDVLTDPGAGIRRRLLGQGALRVPHRLHQSLELGAGALQRKGGVGEVAQRGGQFHHHRERLLSEDPVLPHAHVCTPGTSATSSRTAARSALPDAVRGSASTTDTTVGTS
jgi:hypothetical protein